MKRTGLENRRLAQRTLFYFKMGWSMYLWYIVDFIASITVIYVLLIATIPGTLTLFPDILRFSLVATLAVFIVSDIFGWLHYHKLGIFAAEQDIATESSPYTTEMLTLSLYPFMRVVYELGKVSHLQLTSSLSSTMKQCEKILRKSEERWGLTKK